MSRTTNKKEGRKSLVNRREFIGAAAGAMSNAPITGGPTALMEEYNRPEHDVDMGGISHHANWFDCIKTREKPYSHEEIGHRAASLGHLTIIAYKLGRSLKWDPVREVFPEDEQANRLLRRAKRAPWHL